MSADGVAALAHAIAASGSIIAFTGAGVSTESGIPDFRSPTGIWSRFNPADFTIQNYVRDPEHRKRSWAMRKEFTTADYRPNPAHLALAELERMGKLDCVVTQNIDGLHQKAGNTSVLELHGHTRDVVCLSCGSSRPTPDVIKRLDAGEEDPACERCGGILKVATVSFGQALPQEVLAESFARAASCDLCLVVGSSLAVYPAADVPLQARQSGARLAIVNNEPTPMDDIADPVIHGTAGEILPAAVAAAKGIAS